MQGIEASVEEVAGGELLDRPRGKKFEWLCQRWRPGLLLGVALVGLAEWGLHHYWASRAPSMQQWRRLAPDLISELEEQVQKSESKLRPLVVVEPLWAEPMARAVLGDAWMPLAHIARADDSGFREAVELSMLGSHGSWQGWSLQGHGAVGPFELRSFVNPEAPSFRYQFVDQLTPATASVHTFKGGRQRQCGYAKRKMSNGDLHGHPTFPSRRFACAGGEWHFVGATVIEDQDYRPRRCIWAHPGPGEILMIEFADVPLGRSVRGYGGLPYFRGRGQHGTPIEMEVRVAGKVLGVYVHEDGDGWTPFEMSTQDMRGQRSTVQFRIRSDDAAHREFCFQADAR